MKDVENHDETLPEADVRALVRVLGEVAAIRAGHDEKKRALMDGLCRIIGADFWVWTLWRPTASGVSEVYENFQHGGFSPERYAIYRAAIDHPRVGEIIESFEMELARKRSHLTRTLEQFDGQKLLPRSEVGALFDAAGIGPIMISCRPLEGGVRSAIGLYRHDGRAQFGPREARIAHIVLTEVPWLHFDNTPKAAAPVFAGPRLSRGESLVMGLLAEGLGRKEIAARARLSEHTVNDYAKAVYRHLGVRSQSALIRKLTRGDGGDRP